METIEESCNIRFIFVLYPEMKLHFSNMHCGAQAAVSLEKASALRRCYWYRANLIKELRDTSL